jgi:hypothetical protein
MIENDRFGLVFAKTGSINSATVLVLMLNLLLLETKRITVRYSTDETEYIYTKGLCSFSVVIYESFRFKRLAQDVHVYSSPLTFP